MNQGAGARLLTHPFPEDYQKRIHVLENELERMRINTVTVIASRRVPVVVAKPATKTHDKSGEEEARQKALADGKARLAAGMTGEYLLPTATDSTSTTIHIYV